MAVSQASIIEALESIVSNLDQSEFIYSFLDAYGFPKSTITRLRKEGDSRNVAENGDIALRKQLYFRAVTPGTDLDLEMEYLREGNIVERNDIRFIIVTDFSKLVATDLKANDDLEIELVDLDTNYGFFLPLAGYEKAVMYSEHPADLKASEKMGQLFDLIRERNDLSNREDIHALNVFLTRLLFCFYAEDTGIFDEGQFTYALQSYAQEDGSDLDQFFYDLFTVLNLEEQSTERKKMRTHFQSFKYVNGGLFSVDEAIPEFSRKARRILLECARLNWSEINPDIFGSMFQSVIDEEQRGNLGQHYTSVSNIMKVIQPLFLDVLYAELEKYKGNEKKLKALLVRLQNLSIFDPACGSGNFLIIAYKELRRLEMQVIDALNIASPQSVMYYTGIKLSQFYGIEIDDFACEVATLSLWLAEHQMNTEFKEKFGYAEAPLPLRDSGNIICGNSLRIDWEAVCPPVDGREIYICGNPPFLGHHNRQEQQVNDMRQILGEIKGLGKLDYVACWIVLSSIYISKNNARSSFVSTNSICQGEQVPLLWPFIFSLGVELEFAYNSFTWDNNAKSNAAVHVVILGLAKKNSSVKRIYCNSFGSWNIVECQMISGYLVPNSKVIVKPSRVPIYKNVLAMINGSEYSNSEYLILTKEEAEPLFSKPEGKWIKKLIGATEFINGTERFCFWLVDASKQDIEESEIISNRVNKTRELRLSKTNKGVLDSAKTPHLFKIPSHPKSGDYLVVPRVSSERRKYIPIGFRSIDTVATNAVQIVPNATLYEFGVLTSEMHNDWMRTVAGRLKSDYRYSATLVYNTFPWPDITEPKREEIKSLGEEILLTREDYPGKTLAELYDPNKMPEPLLKAHRNLDRAVEALYRDRPFRDASERLEYLFARYEKLIVAEQAQVSVKKKKGVSNNG